MTTIGERIYNFRKKIGLSQEELADKVGVSRQTVSKWEMNTTQPNADNIKALSAIFQVSADSLLLNEAVHEEIIKEIAFSGITDNDVKKNKKIIWLVIGAIITIVVLAVAITSSFLVGFTVFSSNVGDDHLSTSQLDVSVFIITVVVSFILLLVETLLIYLIAKRKLKM